MKNLIYIRCLKTFLFCSILILGLSFRVYLSFNDDGIFWPDEIYQGLEQAHRLVFGYGLLGWEYIVGARPWTFPALIACIMKSAMFLGGSPLTYIISIRLSFCLVSLFTAVGVYRLSRNIGIEQTYAIIAMGFFFCALPIIYFSSRTMAETAGALPLVWGIALLFSKDSSRQKNFLSCILIVSSVFIRIHHALYCILILMLFASQKKWKDFFIALGVFIIAGIIYGAVDKVTWGGWFHSALTYLNANIIQDKSQDFGVSPFWYYGKVFYSSMPFSSILLPFSIFTLFYPHEADSETKRKTRIISIIALSFIIIHSLIPHKEFRFIISSMPLLSVSVGYALMRYHKKTVSTAALLLILISLFFFPSLTFSKLGNERSGMRDLSAFDKNGPINRLLSIAGQEEDICGLLVERVPLEWTGGYSYLHKKIPLYSTRYKYPAEEAFYNYIVTDRELRPFEIQVAQDSTYRLLKLPRKCILDLTYDEKIP